MSSICKKAKKMLGSAIQETEQRKAHFLRCPDKDFTRNRKLPFSKMLRIMIGLAGRSPRMNSWTFFTALRKWHPLPLLFSRGQKSNQKLLNSCFISSQIAFHLTTYIEAIGSLLRTGQISKRQQTQTMQMPIIPAQTVKKRITCIISMRCMTYLDAFM